MKRYVGIETCNLGVLHIKTYWLLHTAPKKQRPAQESHTHRDPNTSSSEVKKTNCSCQAGLCNSAPQYASQGVQYCRASSTAAALIRDMQT